MKRIILVSLALLLSYSFSFSQGFGIKAKDKKGEFTINTIEFRKGVSEAVGRSAVDAYVIGIERSGKKDEIVCRNAKMDKWEPVSNDISDYWFLLNASSLGHISYLTDFSETKADAEYNSTKYLDMLSTNGYILEDPILESYLYQLISKIGVKTRADGLPYDIQIAVVKNDELNAMSFPNGIILINTGLLSSIHSEDELVAALAHEIAHIELNHAFANIAAMQKKQRSAELWGAIGAVTAAALSGVSVAAGGGYYDGSFVYNTAVLSSAIAYQIAEQSGMKYKVEQEKEADEIALEVLKRLGYDKNGVATLFKNMANTFIEDGDWANYYLSSDHPSLTKRIEYSGGSPTTKSDSNFEKRMAAANTSTAIAKFNNGRFRKALSLVERNIANNVATDDDYLIKTRCLLNLYDTQKTNNEAAQMIQLAKSINSNNINIHRTEILTAIRIKDYSKAKSVLQEYAQRIDNSISGGNLTREQVLALNAEKDWCIKMKARLNGYS